MVILEQFALDSQTRTAENAAFIHGILKKLLPEIEYTKNLQRIPDILALGVGGLRKIQFSLLERMKRVKVLLESLATSCLNESEIRYLLVLFVRVGLNQTSLFTICNFSLANFG